MKQETLDKIEEIKIRDNYCCQYKSCDVRSNLEIAHRISKGKYGRRAIKNILQGKGIQYTEKTIDSIIHHPYNVVTSCKKHNDYFILNLATKPLSSDRLIMKILRDLELC